ncbi:hypothetical protein D3C78_1766730 [compost metagenome]
MRNSPRPIPVCHNWLGSPPLIRTAKPKNESIQPNHTTRDGRAPIIGSASRVVKSGMQPRIKPIDVAETVCAAKYANDW